MAESSTPNEWALNTVQKSPFSDKQPGNRY